MISPFARDAYSTVKIWTVICVLSLFLFVLVQESSYLESDALGIWFLSCLTMLFLSRKDPGVLSDRRKYAYTALGILVCALSFLSIPLKISNPPYSIGEFSLLLSGIGIIIFSLRGFRSLVFPVAIPAIAVIGYSAYELFVRNEEWLTAPMIPILTRFVNTMLHLLGINSAVDGNIISFVSLTGKPIYLSIVSDCTGIWSLGTFTVAVIIVMSSFPLSRTRRSLLLIAVGYLGTIIANLLRIFLIALTGYYYGPAGVMQNVHIHIGWVVFSLWMIIFWYYYFTRQLQITFFRKKPEEAKNS